MLPELTIPQFLVLASLGVSVGALGAMVGVGGGFLLVPALLFMFPDASPAAITSMSLTAVFLNALSASVGYRRQRRQDLRTAAILIGFALPAAALGAAVNHLTNRGAFEVIFGVALIIGAVYLAWRRTSISTFVASRSGRERRLLDRTGRVYEYRVNEKVVASVAPGAGFVAGFFGIGGGIINVPVMMLGLRIPPAIAVPTSQIELTAASAAALAVHLGLSFGEGGQWVRAAIVGAGTLAGAQLGVQLAGRVGGRFVLTVLAVGLMLAGVRQIVAALT